MGKIIDHRSLDAKLLPDITWAGGCPWTDNYCFGTEKGHLVFATESNWKELPHVLHDAINGVAFSNHIAVVSSRSELAIYQQSSEGTEVERKALFSNGGAHDVTSLGLGQFAAALGKDGLLFIDASDANSIVRSQGTITDAPDTYIYKMACLSEFGKDCILACADRLGSIVILKRSVSSSSATVFDYPCPNHSLVDICALNDSTRPSGIAALTNHGELILSRDVFQERPAMLSISDEKIAAYSVRCMYGHLFLLTDKSLMVWPDLVKRYVAGESVVDPTHIYELPIASVGMGLALNDLVIIEQDEIMIVDPRQFSVQTPENQRPTGSRSLKLVPSAVHDVTEYSLQLAEVA